MTVYHPAEQVTRLPPGSRRAGYGARVNQLGRVGSARCAEHIEDDGSVTQYVWPA